MQASATRLVTLARRYLPPAAAERWITLIRPAVRLRTTRRGEKRVGQLGGLPALPHDVAWPEWEGEGSLNFVASIDCGRLPSEGFDIAVPDSGTKSAVTPSQCRTRSSSRSPKHNWVSKHPSMTR
jgi:Domain of unknown function (DUF1963)